MAPNLAIPPFSALLAIVYQASANVRHLCLQLRDPRVSCSETHWQSVPGCNHLCLLTWAAHAAQRLTKWKLTHTGESLFNPHVQSFL